MITTRRVLLTDNQGNYIRREKNGTLSLTQNVENATDYSFNILGILQRKAAFKKFGKPFRFKHFIFLEGNFDINEGMALFKDIDS